MDNKPEMYKGSARKEFNNNRSIYASYSDNYNENINKVYDINEIRNKINDIIGSNNFIYRTKVNIVIGNQILTKKIIGIYNNNLVTIDNEQIPINLINDIYK